MGLEADGKLGDGSTDNSDTPVPVSMPAGVTAKAITGGGAFADVIGSDGNLYGWGIGSSGQLGVTTITGMATTPVLVTLAPGVTPSAISDNLHTGYAIGSDGNVYSWGYGVAGELGNGTFVNGSPPVVVSLPPDSVPLNLGAEPGAAAGYAIVSATPTAPQVTSQPQPQTVLVGRSASFTAAASGYPRRRCSGRSRPTAAPPSRPSRADEQHPDRPHHDARSERGRIRRCVLKRNGTGCDDGPRAADRER